MPRVATRSVSDVATLVVHEVHHETLGCRPRARLAGRSQTNEYSHDATRTGSSRAGSLAAPSAPDATWLRPARSSPRLQGFWLQRPAAPATAAPTTTTSSTKTNRQLRGPRHRFAFSGDDPKANDEVAVGFTFTTSRGERRLCRAGGTYSPMRPSHTMHDVSEGRSASLRCIEDSTPRWRGGVVNSGPIVEARPPGPRASAVREVMTACWTGAERYEPWWARAR